MRTFQVSIWAVLLSTFHLSAQAHFSFTANTGNNMTVPVRASVNPTIDGTALASGDEIGVFTPEGRCVGAAVWGGANAAITVWGDNDQTPAVDGIRAGEVLHYRVWDSSHSREAAVAVSYLSGGPSYSVDGIAILSSLAAVTPPEAPVPRSPSDGAAGVPFTPSLRWSGQARAVTYHLQVAASNDFAAVFQQDSTLTDTAKTLGALAAGAQYFWRVRAKNAGGVSAWSAVWSFTTVFQHTLTVSGDGHGAEAPGGVSRVPVAFEIGCDAGTGVLTYAVPAQAGPRGVAMDIRLFDLRGKLLRVVERRGQTPGWYQVTIAAPGTMTPGTAVAVVRAGSHGGTAKLLARVR